MAELDTNSSIFKRLTNVLKRPSTSGQLQCVRCGHRTHKSSAWIFLRAHLKVQRGVLAVLEACSAQVGRFAHACFVRLCRIDNALAASLAVYQGTHRLVSSCNVKCACQKRISPAYCAL